MLNMAQLWKAKPVLTKLIRATPSLNDLSTRRNKASVRCAMSMSDDCDWNLELPFCRSNFVVCRFSDDF
jgi:hypothetical protein